jgi:pimeloyl-ACP methyl ester carboxylesterase
VRGEFLDLDGVRLYYYAAGSRGAGEPILLLHGFPTSGHLWSDVVPLLPDGHRVVVLDLLGFGRSDPPRGHAVDIRAHADRLMAVLDRLRINYACVVGHDIGGAVAQWAAVRYPQRVSRLGLVNSVAFDGWPSREVRIARASLPLTRHLPPSWILSLVRADLVRGYCDPERGAHEVDLYLRPFADANGRDALVAHLTALDCRDTNALAPRLRDIVCPTAVICGADDPFLPPALGLRLADAISGASFESIAGARHFLPEENAGSVAATIRDLLRRHTPTELHT